MLGNSASIGDQLIATLDIDECTSYVQVVIQNVADLKRPNPLGGTHKRGRLVANCVQGLLYFFVTENVSVLINRTDKYVCVTMTHRAKSKLNICRKNICKLNICRPISEKTSRRQHRF